jgi:methyl-accepting chemotaxis protein
MVEWDKIDSLKPSWSAFMKLFKNQSIGFRIFFLLGVMLLFLAGVVLAFLTETTSIKELGVNQTQRIMLADQKDKLSVATHSMALTLGELLKGVSDEETRVKMIRQAVDPIRFEADSSGYYFVYKGTINVALPTKKDAHGKDLGGLADKNGVYFVRELARQAGQGGGFVEYVFPKPNKGDQPKLSYAEKIPGTEYWIGTGVYIDNIDEAKAGIRNAIEEVVKRMSTEILGGVTGVFILAVLPISLLLIRGIVRPIKAATEAASQVAGGRLDVVLADEGRSEIGVLNDALRHMVDTLKQNLKEITDKTRLAEEKAHVCELATKEADEARSLAERAKADGMLQAALTLEKVAERLSAAAEQISSQAEEVRVGSETQRDRIQTTATAMEEMTATVLEVARNAGHAADEGKLTQNKAEQGAQVVAQTIQALAATEKKASALKEAMAQLDSQARAIGNVITVIEDIADQTNLLALNAAIEAARAGEAGRGFAVVADEVRKLAEKTMSATKEVTASIGSIQVVAAQNVQAMDAAGADLAQAADRSNESGRVLTEIVTGAERAAEQIRSIATAAEEQSAATEEINRSVDEVNMIARNAAHSVEETSRALHEMAEQTAALMRLIAQLKTEGER